MIPDCTRSINSIYTTSLTIKYFGFILSINEQIFEVFNIIYQLQREIVMVNVLHSISEEDDKSKLKILHHTDHNQI